jgi:formate dehydrogenase iron-sulfur subunit
MKIYVPRDAAARALGADAVAAALAAEIEKRGIDARIVRNGSRGMVWLEPLVEIEQEGRRLCYGPVTANDVAALLDGTFPTLGPVEDIPFFARQTRLTFARVGLIDPLDLADYQAHGGLAGLRRALGCRPRRSWTR